MREVFVGVEDDLSFAVATVMVSKVFSGEVTTKRLHATRAGGFGQIRMNMGKYLQLAVRQAVVIFTDLDNHPCAPALRANWLNGQSLMGLISFRVAVREIESWLLADATNLANFLGVKERALPSDPDTLDDPKAQLLSLASKGRKDIRYEIVQKTELGLKQATGYNETLSTFTHSSWNIDAACHRSNSLTRARADLGKLQKILEET